LGKREPPMPTSTKRRPNRGQFGQRKAKAATEHEKQDAQDGE